VESLTEKVLQYQRTRLGLADLMNDLAHKVYLYPRRRMGWDEDACGEFYLFCYSRLVRLLDRFRDQGKPFESYLCSVLGWQLRNFARDRKRGEKSWNVALRLEPGRTVTDDNDSPGDGAPGGAALALFALDPGIGRLIRTPTDRRNFLFFVLKSSRHIGPERCPALAELAGVSADRLEGLLAELRQGRAHREARLEAFGRRRNAAFCQVRLLETELAAETDGEKRDALSARLRKARTRMRGAMEKMARVGLAPTNREIGRILGVPKGTVDSGLYWLKKKLAPVYDPDSFRSA
jgi:DNA-directed RNA polymerase specialized sigma24 family protein